MTSAKPNFVIVAIKILKQIKKEVWHYQFMDWSRKKAKAFMKPGWVEPCVGSKSKYLGEWVD